MSEFKPIIVIGLNAVWQKTMSFPSLALGSVHRAKRVQTHASGKGANVAWALARCGHTSTTLLQALGGITGKLIADDLQQASFQTCHVSIAAESRVCTTLLEPQGRCTELIEPSPELCEQEWHQVALELEQLMDDSPCDVLVSGSFPLGPSHEIFEALTQRPTEVNLWVDSIDVRWLTLRPEVLKVNLRELHELCAGETHQGPDSAKSHIQHLAQQHGISKIVVTNEDQPGWLYDSETCSTFSTHPIPNPINVIGAGDTFLAGLVFAHQQQLNFGDAVDFASRLAAQRCQVETIHQLIPCELTP